MLRRLWPLASLVAFSLTARAETPGDLVVHEWGTFLAMSGSDGATLEGMYHEEHALPPFVHARSRDQLRLPSMRLKGETPVIYFYTGHPQKVRVDVRFPRGLWTQWYPQAQAVGPQLDATSPADPRHGHITWCADLLPAGAKPPTPAAPAAARDALWNFARDVDAAYVQTIDRTKEPAPRETERFLFYRGLGRAPLPLRLTAESIGTIDLACDDARGVQHAFLIHVGGGRGAYAYLPRVRPGEHIAMPLPSLDDAAPLDEFTRRLADDLAARLVDGGLYPKEARAMVNTWRSSYFRTDGVRALFVLPRATTDALIPMTIEPAPKELVRVMVGRVELLTPERERLAEQAVRDLASADAAARGRAYDVLRAQGRYVEPILRRVLKTTADESVRAQCRRLLLSGFVTELRVAAQAPARGPEDAAHVGAQLASLLRDIGLDAEARAEGSAALAALRSRKEPPLERSEARTYLRAIARATEGLGDDRGAAAWYDRLIRFGSQVGSNRQCIGCHGVDAPRELSWFRDWWAGRKYAESVRRAGLLDQTIVENERAGARDPNDVAARMRLAYLYESRGDAANARALWAVLCGPEPETVVRATP